MIMSFSPGDRVYVDPATPGAARSVLGRVWIVSRVNRVNVVCRPEDGIGRGINYPASSLVALGADDIPADASRPAPRPYVPTEQFFGGEVVLTSWSGGKGKPYVISRDNGDTVSAVPLFGDHGRYIRVGKSTLTRLDAAALAETLVAAL
jgi:hypothetical protein